MYIYYAHVYMYIMCMYVFLCFFKHIYIYIKG